LILRRPVLAGVDREFGELNEVLDALSVQNGF